MIQLRYNPFSGKHREIDFVKDETLDKLISRALKEHYGSSYTEELDSQFQIVVSGNLIPKELLDKTILQKEDNVIIAPIIKGDSERELFKAVVTIAVTAYVASVAGPAGWYWTVAASIGTGMVLQALIPPPTLDKPEGSSGDLSQSQMYSISGQSNQIRRGKTVPKVYGKHRVYPSVASNPYILLKPSKNGGDLEQYLYVIYDFGLGPMYIDEASIRIGETPLSNYKFYRYRLVDPNKPQTDEGIWDEQLNKDLDGDGNTGEFEIYYGDVTIDDNPYALNKDEIDGGSSANYQVIRNCASNPDNYSQLITLDFAFPQGLISYNSEFKKRDASVRIRLEFAKVGTNTWYSVDDTTKAKNFSIKGLSTEDVETFEIAPGPFGLFDFLGSDSDYYRTITYRGLKKGQKKIYAEEGASNGSKVYHTASGDFLGKIVSQTATGMPTGIREYTLDRVFKKTYTMGSYIDVHQGMYHREGLNIYSTFTIRPADSDEFVVTGRSESQQYLSVSFQPKEKGEYKVRITRVFSFSDGSKSIRDDMSLIRVMTRFNRQPIYTDKRHTFLEIEIKASNQISGNLDNLSAEVHSVLDVYDDNTQTWSKQLTSNPAWVFADLLTGEVNKRAVDKSRLDLDSLVEWSEYCDEVPADAPNYTFERERASCNFVLDYDTTLQGVINQVTSMGQASLNIVDGKYGVLIDKLRNTPVQVFTPRNSWGFSSTRTYVDVPNVLKVKYIDPGSAWQLNESMVYDTGFSNTNFVTEDELTAFACTNAEQAYRFGRYMMAQYKLRLETIKINVDFEYLVCTRGDYVRVTQDVMKVGGHPARVKSVSGNQITIDAPLVSGVGTYGYIYRNANTGISAVDTLTIIDSTTFTLDGSIPSVGDLIVIGLTTNIAYDCIVKSITPNADMTAELLLIEKADGVYDAESSEDFPTYDPFIVPTQVSYAPSEVQNLEVIENSWRVVNNDYQYYVDIDWDLPLTGAADAFEIYVAIDDGSFEFVDVVKSTDYEYIVDHDNLDIEHHFKVLAVAANGDKIGLADVGEVVATPLRKVTPPSDVSALYLNVTNQVLQLEWPAIPDADIRRYMIRFSPDPDALWEQSVVLLEIDKGTVSASVQARTGKYLIKAYDINGNQSSGPAMAFTSIPELFGLNFIEETNDFPTLPGVLDKVVTNLGGISLQEAVSGVPDDVEYYPEGYYYYEQLLDLGEIYTVRLQSLVQAQGYSPFDLMINWTTLDELAAMSNSGSSDWDVRTEVRYTDDVDVMANWPSLDVIDPINVGFQELWSDWKEFIMGDFTGRIFQYRLKLISNVLSVSPLVFDGVIKADMPDRIDSYNNLVSGVGTYTVVYDYDFYGPGTTPAIQITQDAMSNGDYFVITNKTLSSFDITFYDISNTVVSRQFDVMVRGYGRKHDSVII